MQWLGVLAIGAVVAFVAVHGLGRLYRAYRFAELAESMRRRSRLAAALMVALVALTAFAVDLVGGRPLVGAGIGATVCVFLLAFGFATGRRALRLTVLGEALADEGRRPAALAELKAIAARTDTKHGMRVLVVAMLNRARLFSDMEEVAAASPTAGLPKAHQAMLCAARSVGRLYAGDLPGARALIEDGQRRRIRGALSDTLRMNEALLVSLEGDPGRALELAGPAPPKPKALKASWHIARAHAYAALDDEPAARRELSALVDERGRDGLERMALLPGPSARLATALARDLDAPYR